MVLSPIRDSHPVFFYYFLLLQDFGIFANPGAIPSLNERQVAELPVVFTELQEQTTIASYLDHKTSLIDTLIEKKQKQIELLQEQRTAIINQAVTKGLDPNVPMKYSGIEWLGEVPAHWELKKLKYLVPEVTVGIVIQPAKLYTPSGIPCLRALNIAGGWIDSADLVFIGKKANEKNKKSQIYAGDILIVRTGLAGTAVIVPEEFDGANCVDLLIIRKSDLILSEYFASLPSF